MENNENKKILMEFYDALNRKDWATIESFTHDEVQDSLIGGWKSNNVEVPNPWEPFLIALGFGVRYVTEFIQLGNNYRGKTSFIKSWKMVREIMSDFQIYEMVAEEEKVIGKVSSLLHLPNGEKVSLDTFSEYLFRDSKIIAWLGTNRLLNSLQQFGKIAIQGSNPKEIERYIASLKHMGLLPKNH